MEAFKAYEREAKTKAFSKEGLARQREKEMKGEDGGRDITEWLQDRIEELKRQMEVLESEIESEASKKKKASTEVSESRLERHKFHLDGLEKLLRMWENEAIERDQIENVKDDIDYYVDNNQDDDFMENETIYDDLGLDDWDPEDIDHEYGDYDPDDAEEQDGSTSANDAESTDGSTSFGGDTSMTSSTTSLQPPTASSAIGEDLPSKNKSDETHGAIGDSSTSLRGSSPLQQHTADLQASSLTASNIAGNFAPLAGSSSSILPPPGSDGSSAGSILSSSSAGIPPSSTGSMGVVGTAGASTGASGNASSGSATIGVPRLAATTRSAEAELLELAGLKASARYLPEPEPTKMPYKPRNPAAVPASYPHTPAQNLLDDPATFAKFPPDLLFFLFYFQQNSYQQYLAARELKRQSWRYHTKYLTWFQRHEDPKTINPEFEQGTYVYFDYETGWCQRKKSEFTFQYIFLEDNELP